ncbi:High affinity nitrate transporter 2.7 [Zea mays]|uniref:High affinity nitrate transporter 2.7 n=2 Tax=Zea mays TaxID=4577 RepID=A0A1D6H7Z9_MAIZE|nr:High affinity nitrate transporter 2.7 [Zea mays]
MGKKLQLADDEENCWYGVGGAEAECGVDDEFRATDLRPLSLLSPHTQAFHLAWLSLFVCFFAAFAAPPILPALRPALVLMPSDAPAAAVGSLSATLLVMPLAYELVLRLGVPITVAWRVTYLLPCTLLITTGLAVLAFPNDHPRGVGAGAKTGNSLWKVVPGGVGNYRAWVLALTYGYCYGVELIMENVAANFFRKRFHLPWRLRAPRRRASAR